MTTIEKLALEQQIEGLENHIASRKDSLPYIDRGYFEEKKAIKALEIRLQALKKKRGQSSGS